MTAEWLHGSGAACPVRPTLEHRRWRCPGVGSHFEHFDPWRSLSAQLPRRVLLANVELPRTLLWPIVCIWELQTQRISVFKTPDVNITTAASQDLCLYISKLHSRFLKIGVGRPDMVNICEHCVLQLSPKSDSMRLKEREPACNWLLAAKFPAGGLVALPCPEGLLAKSLACNWRVPRFGRLFFNAA